MTLKRDPVKYIRDRAKSAYAKGSKCEICGTHEELEFHHYFSVSELFRKWLRLNKLKADTEEQILAIRDQFISDHHDEIYNQTVTLCKDHHSKLHKVYGRNPTLATAKKQPNWVEKQRAKLNGTI